MTQGEMGNLKVGLADLFKTEINLIMRESKPRTGDWEDWQALEGAYEEALHLFVLHVVKILKRDEKKIYGFRQINSRIQKARAEQREEFFTKQDIQKRLLKLKSKLEQFEECHEDSPAAQWKQVKIVTELNQFLKLVSPEARAEVFGEKSNEAISEGLKSTEEHRTKVIDWLDARIADEIVKGFKRVAARLKASKIQDTYRTSKSAAMKRYINKRGSLPCPIDEVEVYEYF
jgi:hypothetical protein